MSIASQIAFLSAGSDVSRYHTVFTIQRETVGHHSHGVAVLCSIISPQTTSLAVLKAALLHDLAECETGDIPSPAKRTYGIGRQVAELEMRILYYAGFDFPGLSPAEERLLKLADLAQGAIFSAREIQLGNSALRKVFDRYIEYAEKMGLEGRELEVFNVIKGMAS